MSDRLRLAFFVDEFPATGQTLVLNQIAELQDLGHTVTIFANRARSEPLVDPEVGRHRLQQRTRYLRMPARGVRAVVAAALALRHGWTHWRRMLRSLDVRRYGRDAWSFRLFFWTVRSLGEGPFDVIHCHSGPLGQVAAKLRDFGAISGRLVTAFHAADLNHDPHKKPDRYRFLFAFGDLFLSSSRRSRRRLLEIGCAARRTDVHRTGVPVKRFAFRARRLDPGRPLRLISVCRLVERKGLEYAFRAVDECIRQGISVRYDVIGDGPLQAALAGLVRSLGIAEHVRFHGLKDQEAVRALMDESDVLLAPSVTADSGDEDGIPVPLIEAMAAGMLVVSTYHSGIPELVEHNHSGLLVAERNAAALAETLVLIVENPEFWPLMSRSARARVVDAFDLVKLTETLVRRYWSLLGLQPRSRATGNRPLRKSAS